MEREGFWARGGGYRFPVFQLRASFSPGIGSFEVSAPVLKTHKQSLTGKARVPG